MMKGFLLISGLFVTMLCAAQEREWKGGWITRTEDTAVRVAPYFRKEFAVGRTVKRATAYVCGVGYHIVTVNGAPVAKGVMEQVYTNYEKRLQYAVYDVTKVMGMGINCIGVELGNGWYNVQSKNIWFFHTAKWRKSPRLLMDVVVEYKDGSSDTVRSDGSWKCAAGASQFNSLLAGEIYDATKELAGWNLAGFDDAGWASALVTGSPGGRLEKQEMPSVALIKTVVPVGVRRQGSWPGGDGLSGVEHVPACMTGGGLYDMGENFAGVVKMRVQGKRGDTVTLRYGEVLDSAGRLDLQHNASMMLYEPGDLTFQTDMYVLRGDGVEEYTPRFTYHGFQYVLVSSSSAALQVVSLEGLFYSAGFEQAGGFKSSDTMLNKLYAAAMQSYRSNFYSMPTDCPTREKMGWQADGLIVAESGLWNFKSGTAYKKWLDDIMDTQISSGLVAGVAPTDDRRGYRWPVPPDPDFGPLWCSGGILLPWYLYLYEGDTSRMRVAYGSGKRYMEYMRSRDSAGLYTTGLGDWLAIEPTNKTITSTGYYYNNAVVMGKMAGVLGLPSDMAYFKELATTIKSAFNKHFFDEQTKNYKDSTLAAISTAVYYGLCPDSFRNEVIASLSAAVKRKGYKVDYGLLGSKTVIPSLRADDAYRLLTDTSAGYGRMIARGATTLWEDWDGAFSRNHPSFGAFVGWFYSGLVGIGTDETAPGFKHFFVRPLFPTGVDWVEVWHDTKFGRIEVKWKRVGSKMEVSILVPKGSTAEFELPGAKRKLSAGKNKIVI